MAEQYILAIDVGKGGGIAILGPLGSVACMPMPDTDGDFIELIRETVDNCDGEGWRLVAYVEDVPSYCGKNIPSSRSFVLGKHFGFCLGVLESLNADVRLVRPQKWQKTVAMARTKGATQTEWKNKLKGEAQRRFPELRKQITLKTSDALLILAHALLETGNRRARK